MNKIIVAALTLAVGLNIIYTVYSYNEMNKWRNTHVDQHEQHDKQLTDQLSFMTSLIDTNLNVTKNINDESRSSDNKIVETMMNLETRLYELEDKLEMLQCNPLANDCK